MTGGVIQRTRVLFPIVVFLFSLQALYHFIFHVNLADLIVVFDKGPPPAVTALVQANSSASQSLVSLVSADIVQKHNVAAEKARQRLMDGMLNECGWKQCMFNDVITSLPLKPPLLTPGDGTGQSIKAMINPDHAFPHRNCVVYGLGIDKDSSFEQRMTRYCNEVHAFDCTVETNASSVVNKNFTFHQTCIATKPTGIDNTTEYGVKHRELHFLPLHTVMQQLGHERIDLLKFDIEGAEWELLETEILDHPNKATLPRQLQFELHTKYANPRFVPPSLVHDKDKVALHRLILRLFDLGYRIYSKELNNGDSACAELAMVLVD